MMKPKNDGRNHFKYLQDNLKLIILPCTGWSYSTGNEMFFGFQKMESDCSVKKRIAFLQNGQINIYINDKIHPLSKFIVIADIEELNDFLNVVDKL